MTSVETFEQGTRPADKAMTQTTSRLSLGVIARFPYGLALAWLVIVTVLLWAIVPGLFTSYDPLVGVPGGQLKAPSAAHWLGTDSLGRDLFSRLIYGAVNSLSGAIAAVGVGLIVGTAIGLLAGSIRGRTDEILMRLVDVLLSIPTLLLSLSIIILLGFGTLHAAIAVGATAIAGFARLMRSEVVRVRNAELSRPLSAAAAVSSKSCGGTSCPTR